MEGLDFVGACLYNLGLLDAVSNEAFFSKPSYIYKIKPAVRGRGSVWATAMIVKKKRSERLKKRGLRWGR